MKKWFTEEQITGFLGGGQSRPASQRAMPTAWVLGSQLLPVEIQVRRHERLDAKRLKELETENARLKKLLAESMLENEVTREALKKSGNHSAQGR